MSGLDLESKGLLRQALLEPDKHLAMHPAPQIGKSMGVYPHPLSSAG